MTAIELTDKNYSEEVLNSKIPVLVDFWAEWCSPCKEMAPKFENVAKKFQGKVKFAKLNVEKYEKYTEANGIRGIPCFILFKNGKEVGRIVGARQESEFAEMVAKML